MESICENISVVLQRGEVLKAVKILRGKKIVFGKFHLKPDNAFGQPFGSCFEVLPDCQLRKIDSSNVTDEVGYQNETDKEMDSVEDNRMLMDTHGKSQSLKREEIIEMKAKGAKGEEIIDEIVKNSASFQGKTAYSQKKYLKKKKQKHMKHIRILKPSARLLCKMYESREPAKICHMRIDTMSQMLSMANLHHGSKVIVVETCSGLILGLTMQRLGGHGVVINLHTGEVPTNFHAVTHFNFPESYWAGLHSLPMSKIGLILANKTFKEAVGDIQGSPRTEYSSSKDVIPEELTTQQSNDPIPEFVPEAENSTRTTNDVSEKGLLAGKKHNRELSEEEKCQIRLERRNKRLSHQHCAWTMLNTREMDALIVSCRYHPTPLVLTLLEFIAPSRPFVVYSENREPLVELFVQLSTSGKAVNMKVSDTFMRQYQVLPEQTHPHVMMSSSGGYLLTGIRVESKDTNQKQDCSSELPTKRSRN